MDEADDAVLLQRDKSAPAPCQGPGELEAGQPSGAAKPINPRNAPVSRGAAGRRGGPTRRHGNAVRLSRRAPPVFWGTARPFGGRPRLFWGIPRLFWTELRLFWERPRLFWETPRLFRTGPRLFGETARLFRTGLRLFWETPRPFRTGPRLFGETPRPFWTELRLFWERGRLFWETPRLSGARLVPSGRGERRGHGGLGRPPPGISLPCPPGPQAAVRSNSPPNWALESARAAAAEPYAGTSLLFARVTKHNGASCDRCGRGNE
jgi:hypothetical protein